MMRALSLLALSVTASAYTIGMMPQRPACAAARADSPVMMPKFLKDLCAPRHAHNAARTRLRDRICQQFARSQVSRHGQARQSAR